MMKKEKAILGTNLQTRTASLDHNANVNNIEEELDILKAKVDYILEQLDHIPDTDQMTWQTIETVNQIV